MRIDLLPVFDSSTDHHRRPWVEQSSVLPDAPSAAVPVEGRSSYEQLLHSIYDGVMVTSMDGSILEVNRRLLEFLRMTREQACAKTLFDVLSGADPSLMLTLREHLASQRFAVIQAFCVRSDGSLFPAEIAVNDLGADGDVRLCFFVRDVTVRRQQEQMLWTEHNAILNSGSGIAVAGMDGRIEYANPAMAAMWGRASGEELVGVDVRQLFTEELAADAMVSSVLTAETPCVGQMIAARRDGAELHVQVSAGCNRLSDGDVIGLVFSFIDITDKMRAERAIRQAERQRVMLESLGAACHHLGQPATVLQANIEMMSQAVASDRGIHLPDLPALIDSCLRAIHRMGKILHRLNSVNEYRTTEYISDQVASPDASPEQNRILEI